jgi:hypothetical protein
MKIAYYSNKIQPNFRKEKLQNDITILKSYISKMKPPELLEEKIHSLKSLNNALGTYIVEFKGDQYWVQPWGDPDEFERKYKELNIYKFPDELLGFELKRYVYNLYKEDKESNKVIGLGGKNYNYVRIGDQIWMVENLNIEIGVTCNCYDDDQINYFKNAPNMFLSMDIIN